MKAIPIRQINPAQDEPKISQTFRIREVQSILNGKDLNQELHRHNFFFVLAIRKGKGTHAIDFNSYEVTDNCIFIMRPGQVHELHLKARSTGYLMEFNLEFYHMNEPGTKEMLRRAANSNLCQMSRDSFEKLRVILEYIFNEYQHHQEGYQEIIRAQLDIFFIEFNRNRLSHKANSPNVNAYEQEKIELFLQLVETNVTNKKQVTDYTDMLNLSSYQLGAMTKRILGKTPSELINDFIILESKRHLLATADQVNQIAWHLGYEDPSYFIRFFKKHTGYSPETFRANSK